MAASTYHKMAHTFSILLPSIEFFKTSQACEAEWRSTEIGFGKYSLKHYQLSTH